MAPEKKKAPKALPTKPSTLSEEQWSLAHNSAKLLELLSAVEGRGHSASSKAAASEKPLASKPTAALWLSQLLESSAEAAEEAYKAGAVEICAKLISTHSNDHALLPSVLIALARLADPAAGPQTTQVRESILSCRPAIVPALLSQLEQSYTHQHSTAVASRATHHLNSTSTVAAALHMLHNLVLAPDTRLRVAKLLVVWNMKPLITALASPVSLPLEGGRNAATDAAALLEVLCTPAAAQQEAPGAEGSKKGGKKSAKDKDANSKDAAAQPAAPTGDPIDPTLTAALHQAVLEADGIIGLLRLCAGSAAAAAARTAAAAALHQLMTAHGLEDDVKAVFSNADGLSIMVKLMVAIQLPLKARAAAAGCIWHYLAPQPAVAAAAHTNTLGSSTARPSAIMSVAPSSAAAAIPDYFISIGSVAAPPATAATSVQANLGLSGTFGRPVTSHEAQANIIAAARLLRKQQHDEAAMIPSGSTKVSSNGGASSSGGTSSVSSSISGATAQPARHSMTAAAVPGLGTEAQAAADAAAAYQAALAVWDEAAQAGLTARAEQVVQSGCIPALLLMCCGPDGPPAGLEAAAVAAAALADARQTSGAAQSLNPAAATGGANGAENACAGNVDSSSSSHTDSAACRRKTLNSATAKDPSRGLGAIAEPTHGEEGADEADDGDSQQAATSALDGNDNENNAADSAAADTAAGGAIGKKAKKKAGKKGSTTMSPEMHDAQAHASAVLKLLAMSGDAGRAALQEAGAKAVLTPLLAGQNDVARWNARQVLVSMALVGSYSKPPGRSTASMGLLAKAGAAACSKHLLAPAVQVGAAAATDSNSRSGPSWLLASGPMTVPIYITMDNMPASHYQRSAPISQVPLPVLPVIPGRARVTEGGAGTAAGSFVGAGGALVPGASRPSSQSRRLSVSNTAGQIPASRMSSAHNNSSVSTIAGEGLAMGAEGSFAGSSRMSSMMVGKGVRGSLLATATGVASSVGPAGTHMTATGSA